MLHRRKRCVGRLRTGGVQVILNLIVGAVTVTCALILHELGHALVALALGCKVEQFHVWRGGMLGGPRAAIWTMSNRKHELVVALAGPAVNILLAQSGGFAWQGANWTVALLALTPMRGSDGLRAWGALRGPARARVRLSDRLFGCGHPERSLTWPRTRRTDKGTESYQVCLDCGRKLPYQGELVTK